MFGLFKKKTVIRQFPPVPDWRPAISPEHDRIESTMRYYTNNNSDFVMFEHGTCVVVEDGLSDEDADIFAKTVLHEVFYAHPDMNPTNMNDGNILVRYNHPAFNVVFSDVVQKNWVKIDKKHLDALATSEVLITPMGQNQFDDFGKKALFGRCHMFMDAQMPKAVRVVRKTPLR